MFFLRAFSVCSIFVLRHYELAHYAVNYFLFFACFLFCFCYYSLVETMVSRLFWKGLAMASNDAVLAGLRSLEKRLEAQVARQEKATADVKTQLVALRDQIASMLAPVRK